MSKEPEEVIFDALSDNDGCYPHQLADRIADALRAAGYLKPSEQ